VKTREVGEVGTFSVASCPTFRHVVEHKKRTSCTGCIETGGISIPEELVLSDGPMWWLVELVEVVMRSLCEARFVFPARVLDSGIRTTRVTLELQSIGFHKLMQFFVFGVTNETQLGNVLLVKLNDLPGTRGAKG
jgi:hypothetical protein